MKKFDYKSYNYIKYSTMGYMNSVGKTPNIVLVFAIFFARLFYYTFFSRCKNLYSEDILVIVPSLNNRRSIDPILKKLNNQKYTYCTGLFQILPYRKVYWESVLWLPCFIRFYCSSAADERIMMRKNSLQFLTAPGYVKVADEFYKTNMHIKLVIFSNDHIGNIRCMIQAAKNNGIKTMYSQHASVTTLFPPLIFDYSFLDGIETLEKYRQCGPISGDIILCGSPRFDAIMNIDKKDTGTIGVAVNMIDDLEKVFTTCKELISNGFDDIIVRPHPRQEIEDWTQFSKIGVRISFPGKESSFYFLSELHYLLSGNSSIHLEAALMGIPSICCNWTDQPILDSYGYVKKGLVPIAKDKKDVLSLLLQDNKPDTNLVKYYVASYNSTIHGKTSEICAGFITSLLKEEQQEFLDRNFTLSHDRIYSI